MGKVGFATLSSLMKWLFVLLFIALESLACPVSPESLLSLKNRPKMKSLVVSENGVTEREFRDLIGRVRAIYDARFAARGHEVEFLLYWDVEEGNAMTSFKDGKAYFAFSGGLLRGRYMTKDGFLFAACHEMGHHFGGFPKEKELNWCSVEGQADYFANLQCMKEVLKGDAGNAAAESLVLPANVKRRCRDVYADDDSYQICLRSAKAAEDAMKFLQAKQSGKDPDESMFNRFMFPVGETIQRYPDYACRAESGYRGAICNKSEELSDTDETSGFCHKNNGDKVGERPRCWFKPGV